ncbi:hypothetical protein [Nocardia thraciensis]
MQWGFVYSAGLSLITFALLFQPWLTTSGPKGQVTSDAFGRMRGVTTALGDWQEADGAHPLHVSGGGGVVAATAALMTILAVVMYLFDRRTTTALIILGSSAALALSVFCTLLYLAAKAPEFKTLSESSGSGGGLRNILSGNEPGVHEVASANLGFAALLGGVTALGALLVAVTTAVPRRAADQTATPAPEVAPTPVRAIEAAPPAPPSRAPHTERSLSAADRPVETRRTTARRHPEMEGLTIQLPYRSSLLESGPEFAALVGSGARR